MEGERPLNLPPSGVTATAGLSLHGLRYWGGTPKRAGGFSERLEPAPPGGASATSIPFNAPGWAASMEQRQAIGNTRIHLGPSDHVPREGLGGNRTVTLAFNSASGRAPVLPLQTLTPGARLVLCSLPLLSLPAGGLLSDTFSLLFFSQHLSFPSAFKLQCPSGLPP